MRYAPRSCGSGERGARSEERGEGRCSGWTYTVRWCSRRGCLGKLATRPPLRLDCSSPQRWHGATRTHRSRAVGCVAGSCAHGEALAGLCSRTCTFLSLGRRHGMPASLIRRLLCCRGCTLGWSAMEPRVGEQKHPQPSARCCRSRGSVGARRGCTAASRLPCRRGTGGTGSVPRVCAAAATLNGAGADIQPRAGAAAGSFTTSTPISCAHFATASGTPRRRRDRRCADFMPALPSRADPHATQPRSLAVAHGSGLGPLHGWPCLRRTLQHVCTPSEGCVLARCKLALHSITAAGRQRVADGAAAASLLANSSDLTAGRQCTPSVSMRRRCSRCSPTTAGPSHFSGHGLRAAPPWPPCAACIHAAHSQPAPGQQQQAAPS